MLKEGDAKLKVDCISIWGNLPKASRKPPILLKCKIYVPLTGIFLEVKNKLDHESSSNFMPLLAFTGQDSVFSGRS